MNKEQIIKLISENIEKYINTKQEENILNEQIQHELTHIY